MNKDWIEVELEHLLDYLQPTKYIVSSTKYNDSYKTPVLTAGKSFIKGYTDETDNIFKDLPVIIFDDFTTATQFVNFQFKVKSSAMKILVPTSELVNMKYVFYFMQTIREITDTHKRYWISMFSKLPTPLAPLPEQRAIVAKIEQLFSELDNGIANLKTAQRKLILYKQSVLKKAFEGGFTEEWRKKQENLVPATELLKQIEVERQNSYQEQLSEWKLNVKRWEGDGQKGKKPTKPKSLSPIQFSLKGDRLNVSVESISTHIVDCLHSTPKFQSEGMYCVDTTCIADGKILWEKIRFVNEDSFKEQIRRLKPQKGDILFAREGTVGTTLVLKDSTDICIGQRMMMFRSLHSISPIFFMYYFQSNLFKKQYRPLISGTTAQHLNIGDIRKLNFLVYSLPEQNQIVQEIESRLSVCDKVQETISQNLAKAEALRQSILKKAFSGKLLTETELTACRNEADYAPASELLKSLKK
jgi:type I restriction enzyme S subunit